LKRIGTTFEQVYSSVAERAMHTGRYSFSPPFVADTEQPTKIARSACTAVGYDTSKIVTSPLLLEQSQGEWERQIREHIYTKEVKFALNTNNWEFKAPGIAGSDGVAGESQKDVELRFKTFVESLLTSKLSITVPSFLYQ
jgi:broad specificity phosphatase PhoE